MSIRPGDRIKLISMGSDPDPIPVGSTGTVESVTSGPLGQVGVKWDSGRTLHLLPGIDVFALIADSPKPQNANSNLVRIPEAVLTGIEAVRHSGLTNMLDLHGVQRIAMDLGFEETADWMANCGNHSAYSSGIFQGFTPDGQ